MLFILRTGVVIQLNLFGKHWRKDEYHTNVDLLPPYCACPMYDLSRLVPYGEDHRKRTGVLNRSHIGNQHQCSFSFINSVSVVSLPSDFFCSPFPNF